MALTNRYKLTNQRLIMTYGFIGRRTEEIDLFRVNDVGVKQHRQGVLQGGFGIQQRRHRLSHLGRQLAGRRDRVLVEPADRPSLGVDQ